VVAVVITSSNTALVAGLCPSQPWLAYFLGNLHLGAIRGSQRETLDGTGCANQSLHDAKWLQPSPYSPGPHAGAWVVNPALFVPQAIDLWSACRLTSDP
jgi:hypothetical protein